MRDAVSRWVLRLVAVGVIAAALAYIPYRVYGSEGYRRYRALSAEDEALRQGNEALRAENRGLRVEVRRLRDDLEAVAAVARDELGMVRPDEIVVQIDRGPAAPRGAGSGGRATP